MTPNNSAAVEFLRRWSPLGPWVLTAIQPDRKAITTETFRPADMRRLTEWLETFNGRRNIYFHVNPVMRDMTKKADREDIKEVAWLHVDIDPRAGEDLEAERARALGLLQHNLPLGVPSPTVIVFSGGGYQGFWRLDTPIPVNGDLGLAEDAKRYNQQLELLFGADQCHNIDRIMRLPGTVNLPDARKAKKGREPVLAELVEFCEDRLYSLDQFKPAPAVQMPSEQGFSGGGKTVHVSGNIERLNDVTDLDAWGVPDRVKVIIVQGRHPEEPKQGDNSRSAWLFDAICQLVRCEVPDQVIFSIVTDPEYGISESVLDKGTNAEKYAIRQIERAKEDAVNPWLRKLNEQYAVIGNIGGKCRIVEEVMDYALNRTRLTRQSFDDFRNRFMHIQVEVARTPQGLPVTKPLGKFWLDHPKRRQFDTVVFAPGKDVPNAYNMWKGFACTARPGDCALFLDHLLTNVCRDNTVHYEYLIRWMARAVQQPDTPGEVAVVLRGGRGTGKSFAAKVFGRLFGRHFLHISNSSHLVGNFNSHLRDAVVLFADEAFYAGDKKHASILKTLITEETLTIEAKGVDVEAAPNYVHLIMASNDDHVVPAGGDERRFFVLDVGDGKQQDAVYFAAITKQMAEGGSEALLHALLTMDLDGFQVRNVPRTSALDDQKDFSLDPMEEWWFQKLVDGRVLRRGDGWAREVRKDELVDDFVAHANRFNVTRRGNATILGKFLQRCVPGLQQVQRMAKLDEQTQEGWVRTVERRAYFWVMPSLLEARARWDALHGPQEWSHAEEQRDLDAQRGPPKGRAPY